MTPGFSRELAKVANSPYFIKLTDEVRRGFVKRTARKNKMEDLSEKDKKIIELAMQSIKKGKVWTQ